MRNQTYRNILLKERMKHLFSLSFLICCQHRLSRIIIHSHSATLRTLKTLRLYLLTVDKSKRQTIRKRRPQLLHQIKRQTRASRSLTMQKTHGWIKSDPFKRGAHIVDNQRIEKGYQRIHRIERRPPASLFKNKRILVRHNQPIKDTEINTRGIALFSSHNVKIC